MSASRESPKITRKVDQTEAKAGAAPAPLVKVVGPMLAVVLPQVSVGAMEC